MRTNRAFVQFYDADGKRRQKSLGAWGSPEAQRRYHAELAKWHARQRAARPRPHWSRRRTSPAA